MKHINKTAKKTLEKLLDHLDGDYAKIESGSYMPLILQKEASNFFGEWFSIAHYGLQEGDLMADPHMTFVSGVDGDYYAASFHNDYMPTINCISIHIDGKDVRYSRKMQADHTNFLSQWLRNIKDQGFVDKQPLQAVGAK